jgi:outer membrane lipopolysaccharide assembly protein LptE/RlpB
MRRAASSCGLLARAAMAALALLAAVAPFTGCGYSAGPLTRHGERRIHLPLFENRTWYRDLEVELTRQVEKELASRPGISIVPLESADIVLAGTITDFEQRVLSEDSEDSVSESSAVTRVRLEVIDARTGTVQRQFAVRDRAEFLVARGESLASATSESFQDVARKIVDGLEGDFPRASAAARDEADGAEQQ